jgi:hypothetical protein
MSSSLLRQPPKNFSAGRVGVLLEGLAEGGGDLLAEGGREEHFHVGHPTEDEADEATAAGDAQLDGRGFWAAAGLRALIEQAAGDLNESGAIQLEKIERLERAMSPALSLLGETFSSTWMVRDFVIRYLVEVDMAGQNKGPEDIDDAVSKEKLVLLREASNSIGQLEEAHEVPEELRITLTELAALYGGQGAAGGGAPAA